MNFIFVFKAIIIAIVEGLTEFVPVSSTGHMILVGDLINYRSASPQFTEMYEVVIQLGAILAVVVLYREKIFTSIIEFFNYIIGFIKKDKQLIKKSETGFRFGINVILGSLPAMFFGLVLYDKIKSLFTTDAVAIAFIVGGILLIIIESWYLKNRKKRKKEVKTVDGITYKQSLMVGFFQCLAMWPGMSRSASTIMGGWVAGFNTTAATEFAFFLAIPAMVGSSALDLIKFDYSVMNSTYWVALIVGFVVAFVVSLIVIKKFIDYLKKKPMRVFAIYRVCAGVLLAILLFTKVINP